MWLERATPSRVQPRRARVEKELLDFLWRHQEANGGCEFGAVAWLGLSAWRAET